MVAESSGGCAQKGEIRRLQCGSGQLDDLELHVLMESGETLVESGDYAHDALVVRDLYLARVVLVFDVARSHEQRPLLVEELQAEETIVVVTFLAVEY